MATAIEFNNISKIYRLGLVSTGTLAHDLKRWWTMNIRGQEDPYLTIGETNDRSTKGESEYVWALKDIDFKVEQGDVVGIIGKNGAGKSTLLKILSKVTAPTTGTIRARGRIGSLLEVGTGFHPEMTGRENIYMNGAILGMTKAEISKKLDEIVDFSGCERYIDTPVKRYSSGMMVRLGFAVAAHLDPEILVVDEVLAVGDAEFQKKAIGKMQDVSRGEGRTVLFVSHNMSAVRSLCHTGILLDNGRISYHGNIHETVTRYLSENGKTKPIRLGNGKMQFGSYSLDNTSIETGDDLNILFTFIINQPVDIPLINIVFYDTIGNRITECSCLDDASFQIRSLKLNTEYSVNCSIKNINFLPGEYRINLWAGRGSENYDWITQCMSFNVIQGRKFINRTSEFPKEAQMILQSEWHQNEF